MARTRCRGLVVERAEALRCCRGGGSGSALASWRERTCWRDGHAGSCGGSGAVAVSRVAGVVGVARGLARWGRGSWRRAAWHKGGTVDVLRGGGQCCGEVARMGSGRGSGTGLRSSVLLCSGELRRCRQTEAPTGKRSGWLEHTCIVLGVIIDARVRCRRRSRRELVGENRRADGLLAGTWGLWRRGAAVERVRDVVDVGERRCALG